MSYVYAEKFTLNYSCSEKTQITFAVLQKKGRVYHFLRTQCLKKVSIGLTFYIETSACFSIFGEFLLGAAENFKAFKWCPHKTHIR